MEREFILSEVRRCAEKNGGVALGRERFAAESGIVESNWSGRYWARWSDLVRDAGYEPGSMQLPYGDQHLLDHLALFVRELGRWPTMPELRLKRRADPVFPSPNTFERFGRRAQLAQAVMSYCEAEGGLDDVAAVCRPVASAALGQRPAVEVAAVVAFGFVYLMKSGRYFKLGRTNAVGRRVYEMAIQLPERVELVHSFETDDPEGIERYWHERFAAKRANGEWFSLTREDVTAFKRRKTFM